MTDSFTLSTIVNLSLPQPMAASGCGTSNKNLKVSSRSWHIKFYCALKIKEALTLESRLFLTPEMGK